ncbi:MAG: helix-turn-helix domain-containing protein [Sulfobacillus sp.]
MSAGRPTEYRPEYIETVATMAMSGATDSEIAEEFDVSVTTLYAWRAKHPEFLAALRYGKEHADDRVERSLYHRAVGFTHPAVKISFDKDGKPIFAQYMEYYPPDSGAAKLWLLNRRPAEWREKVEWSGTLKTTSADPKDFSDEELLAIVQARASEPK